MYSGGGGGGGGRVRKRQEIGERREGVEGQRRGRKERGSNINTEQSHIAKILTRFMSSRSTIILAYFC